MRPAIRPLTRLEWQIAAGLAILIWCACAPATRPTPLDFAGRWSGTTSQGRTIAFTVSPDLRVTTLTLGYAFAGCAGTLDVTTDAPLFNTTGTADAVFTYAPNGPQGQSRTTVNFLFPSVAAANGTIRFRNDPTCGDSDATWTATKR